MRRIEDAGGAGVMEGALSTMTEEDIEKFRMERDERHAKAANPRCVFGAGDGGCRGGRRGGCTR